MSLYQYHTLEMLVTQVFLGSFIYSFIEFRKPTTRWKAIWFVFELGILALNGVILLCYEYDAVYARVWPMTMILPYILNLFLVSAQRKLRVLFNAGTIVYLGTIGVLTGEIIRLLLADDWITLQIRIVVFFACILLVVYLREPYLRMLTLLEYGWGALCAIPFLVVMIAVLLEEQLQITENRTLIPLIYLVLVIGCCIYHMIYRFFRMVQEEQTMEYEEKILRLQVRTAEERLQIGKKESQKLKQYRVQIYEKMVALEEELRENGTALHLTELQEAADLLEEQGIVHYCSEPALNTTLAVYARRAKQESIELTIHVNLPKGQINHGTELAVALSNGLSNAVEACMAAPAGMPREIQVTMNNRGEQIAVEIRNTCYTSVRFDSHQLPTSQKGPGHGIGVRSMAAFVQKRGGFLIFFQEDDWFTVRMFV